MDIFDLSKRLFFNFPISYTIASYTENICDNIFCFGFKEVIGADAGRIKTGLSNND